MTELLIALLSSVIWIYLLAARGGFWRAHQRDDALPTIGATEAHWPSIVAVIPARNEAAIIGGSIGSFLRANYRRRFGFLVGGGHRNDGPSAAAPNPADVACAPGR